MQDYKLGFRLLLKYPGLTIAGGLALAIAIGVGAAWFDLSGELLRPRLPLPGGERIVEVEMRNAQASGDEQRLLFDFLGWRRDLRSIEELSAYRTVERNVILGSARPEAVTVAEITASAFRVVRVPPLLGRPLLESDEQAGAPPVVVLGYSVWQQRLGGRADVIGQTIRLGSDDVTVVGVMPEGFTFPINHRLWVPLHLRASGYAPLEGPAICVFGRLAADSTQAQANVEATALTERAAADSPRTHQHLRPRVLAYGGESPGDRSWLEFLVTHLPILLVLLVACANVATLIYARTATRGAEIAVRFALGASRARITTLLFVEALVLASLAAIVGLSGAHWAIQWGLDLYYSGQTGGMPFWVRPGLKLETIVYATLLTLLGAAILGVLPAIKATSSDVQSHLRNLGSGGSTLRFGAAWTAVMIAQVALTVVCIPPAIGISEEAIRDRIIRERFPGEEYLAMRVSLERRLTPQREESDADHAARVERTYRELERRMAREPGVRAVTFADRLPGMAPDVRSGEFEVSPGAAPIVIQNLWTAAVGGGFFESFDVPTLSGRTFHDGDRVDGARAVLVNEAFARRYGAGSTPVGRRVRYASSDPANPEPWFEIVGVVRDIGTTPTDLGEAPYVFRAASPATASPLVVGVRVAGDPSDFAPALRAIAAGVDSGLRIEDLRSLDDAAWRVEVPMMVGASAVLTVVGLGLFLSAAGIFALMSVSVQRRTREIGLRAALGASRTRVLAGVFAHAAVLVGSGVVAGNLVLLFFVGLSDEVEVTQMGNPLLLTSVVMIAAALIACVEPARRALRIQPIDALKEV